ncbi:MAG: hypothetical protein JWO81_2391 [Alphaproteobacteria bacterium]|nr:hypothetical protein [Alphaproteobacteria bacterium]
MSSSRLRKILLIAAAAAGLSACSEGYGYGGMSASYGPAGGYCDPYRGDCYGGYGYDDGYGGYGGYYGDPWYGWYGDYYYPGSGFFVFDRFGRSHRWSDNDRRYWEGRRGNLQNRNWNDPRWQRWDGYRQQGGNNGNWSGQNRSWNSNNQAGQSGTRGWNNGGNGNRGSSGSSGNRGWSGGGTWHHSDGGHRPPH